MIKKITITSLTALSLLLVTANAGEMKCQAGKCGSGMKKEVKKVDTNATEKDVKKKVKMKMMKCQAGKCGGK